MSRRPVRLPCRRPVVVSLLPAGPCLSLLSRADLDLLAALSQGCDLETLTRRFHLGEERLRERMAGLRRRLGAATTGHAVGLGYTLGLLAPPDIPVMLRQQVLDSCSVEELLTALEKCRARDRERARAVVARR